MTVGPIENYDLNYNYDIAYVQFTWFIDWMYCFSFMIGLNNNNFCAFHEMSIDRLIYRSCWYVWNVVFLTLIYKQQSRAYFTDQTIFNLTPVCSGFWKNRFFNPYLKPGNGTPLISLGGITEDDI